MRSPDTRGTTLAYFIYLCQYLGLVTQANSRHGALAACEPPDTRETAPDSLKTADSRPPGHSDLTFFARTLAQRRSRSIADRLDGPPRFVVSRTFVYAVHECFGEERQVRAVDHAISVLVISF